MEAPKVPPELRNVADFLRSGKAGMKTRVGVLMPIGKRVDYFKGKSAIKALLSPAYAKKKNVPKVTSEEEATATLASILPYSFYARVRRGDPSGSSSSPKQLQVEQIQMFKPEEYYAWFYEGSQLTTYLGGIAMVAVMLAAVMFPLWPPIMRLGVWYLSIGVLGLIGLFIAIAIVRLIFYIITLLVASPGIWIFPKLFADVGVIESFIPFWEWDLPKEKKKKKKLGADEKGKSKRSETSTPVNGASAGAYIEELESSGASRPQSRSATVEDAKDDD